MTCPSLREPGATEGESRCCRGVAPSACPANSCRGAQTLVMEEQDEHWTVDVHNYAGNGSSLWQADNGAGDIDCED